MTPGRAVTVDGRRSAAARGGRGMLIHKRPDDLIAQIIRKLPERSPALVHEIKKRPEVKYGLATMCVGDGQGAAAIIERI